MASAPNLKLTRDGESLGTFAIEGEVVLGRAPESTIHVPDQAVSRKHAVFKWVGKSVQVEKKSEFGALIVNGIECTSAILKEGDVISAGAYVLRFGGGEPESSTGPSHATPSGGIAPLSSSAASAPPSSTPSVPTSSEASPESLAEAAVAAVSPERVSEANADLINLEAPPAENGVEIPGAETPVLGEDPNAGAAAESPDFQAPPSEESAQEGESQNAEFEAPVDEDAKTKITPISAQVKVRLIFQPGAANFTDYEIKKESITIGRGKDCDIVLNDKKSSRKNATIRKSGLNFVIKDLQSANGTFVNGAKIQEQELSGEDHIRIGNVEFLFRAVNTEYLEKEKDFMVPPLIEESGPEEIAAPAEVAPGGGLDLGGAEAAGGLVPGGPEAGLGAGGVDPAFATVNTGSIPGITGLPGSSKGGKKTLLERFRALPKRTQMIVSIAILAGVYFLTEPDEVPVATKKPVAKKKDDSKDKAQEKVIQTFETLSEEQKKFVEAQHALAFDYYAHKEYDKALFEIQKIFTLIQEYKDAREIERYAKEGKRKLEAIEEERKKKEEEAQLKSKIAQLVEETRQRMEKKQYEQAKELFVQILGLDPDNTQISIWRKEIDTYEEDLRLQQQQKQVEEEINKQGWSIYSQATDLKKQGHFHEAMAMYQKAIDIGVSDPKLVPAAKKGIEQCRSMIAKKRNPVLAQAARLEKEGQFPQAFALFRKATQIDPPHPVGYAGMNRIRSILHERAKALYTEGILAESYSDFETAKKMYREVLRVAPKEDLYHERAERKLARYFNSRKEEIQ